MSFSGPILVAVVAIVFAYFIYRTLAKPTTYKVFPVWAVLEIALMSQLLPQNGLGRRILYVQYHTHQPIKININQYIRSTKQQLFIRHFPQPQDLDRLPDIERLMAHPVHTLSTEPVQYTLLTRVFGGTDSPLLKKK